MNELNKEFKVKVTTYLTIKAVENIDLESVMVDMDYHFTSQTKDAKVTKSEIIKWNKDL